MAAYHSTIFCYQTLLNFINELRYEVYKKKTIEYAKYAIHLHK